MKVFAALVVLGLVATSTALPRNLKMWPTRIVGGEIVEPHELPYQVSFQMYNSHICGGSVFNEHTIITAAHCCDAGNAANFRISAGRHNIQQTESTAQTIAVSRKIQHAGYDASTIENDICLLIIDTPLVFNENVQPIAIPEEGFSATGDAVVSGWGTTSSGGSSSPQLRKVSVPIVTDEECREAYGEDQIFDSMICAGLPQGGKDSCQGDSGGPLVGIINDLPSLIGVVSWGYGCAMPNYPGVYTEVSYFTKWVEANKA